jgi:disulfide bond formation protein DsbB
MMHHAARSLRWGGWLALLGSGGLLAGAYAFQHIGGMAPCELCLWQRWPHWITVGLGALTLVAVARGQRLWARVGLSLMVLAMVVSVGLAIQHVGVEQKWWAGPGGCTASMGGGSVQDILARVIAAPVVRCDEPAWSLLGISMAGWNGVASLGLAALLALLLLRSRPQ